MLGTVEEGVMGFDVIYLVGVDVSKDFGGEWAAGGVFIPDFCFLLRCFFFLRIVDLGLCFCCSVCVNLLHLVKVDNGFE